MGTPPCFSTNISDGDNFYFLFQNLPNRISTERKEFAPNIADPFPVKFIPIGKGGENEKWYSCFPLKLSGSP